MFCTRSPYFLSLLFERFSGCIRFKFYPMCIGDLTISFRTDRSDFFVAPAVDDWTLTEIAYELKPVQSILMAPESSESVFSVCWGGPRCCEHIDVGRQKTGFLLFSLIIRLCRYQCARGMISATIDIEIFIWLWVEMGDRWEARSDDPKQIGE